MPVRIARLIAPVALLGLAACGGDDAADDPAPPPAAAGWGPLAVLDGGPNTEEALLRGEIDISDRCVNVKTDGAPVVLVWPSEGVRWDAEAEAVLYDDGVRRVELADGDEVALAGGFGSEPEEWSDRWVAEPDPRCAGTAYVVGAISDGG